MMAGGVVAMLTSLPIGWLCFRLRPLATIATIATARVLMIFLKFRDFAWGAGGTTIEPRQRTLMMQLENPRIATSCSAARGRPLDHPQDQDILDGLLPRRDRRGWGRRRGDRRQRAEGQRDIYMISAFLTRSPLFYTRTSTSSIRRPRSANVSIEAALVSIVGGIGTAGTGDRHRAAGNHVGTAAKLARQLGGQHPAHSLQPDPDGGDPVADRADQVATDSITALPAPAARAPRWCDGGSIGVKISTAFNGLRRAGRQLHRAERRLALIRAERRRQDTSFH